MPPLHFRGGCSRLMLQWRPSCVKAEGCAGMLSLWRRPRPSPRGPYSAPLGSALSGTLPLSSRRPARSWGCAEASPRHGGHHPRGSHGEGAGKRRSRVVIEFDMATNARCATSSLRSLGRSLRKLTQTPLMEANLRCETSWDGRLSKTSDVAALSQAGLTSSSAIVMQETLSKASRGPSRRLLIALWLLL